MGLGGAPTSTGEPGEYLRLLELDHVVTVTNGSFSTTSLSRGQRKRLALLTAYLEDRPIYVFDEWAADQDPDLPQGVLPESAARTETSWQDGDCNHP